MRHVGVTVGFVFASMGLLTSGCEQLRPGDVDDPRSTPPQSDAATTEPSVVGAGCGIESNSGAQLCAVTSMCPNVVVDTQSMPNCGFRVRGTVADLVCACGTSLCPMGLFSTCAEAAQLLSEQTEQGVCVQLIEGRCFDTTSGWSSSSSSSSGGNPACDRQCVADCGGGAACASVCNCD